MYGAQHGLDNADTIRPCGLVVSFLGSIHCNSSSFVSPWRVIQPWQHDDRERFCHVRLSPTDSMISAKAQFKFPYGHVCPLVTVSERSRHRPPLPWFARWDTLEASRSLGLQHGRVGRWTPKRLPPPFRKNDGNRKSSLKQNHARL
jgi:hypothetical protein